MSSGSRFIAAAIAALGVSAASAGFLAARRTNSGPPAASPIVSSLTQREQAAAEPTPIAEPSPAVSPEPVATPAVEPADLPSSAPARGSETVLSKAAAPRPAVRTATKPRPSAPGPLRDVGVARPATLPAPTPASEPVVEPPPSRPSLPSPPAPPAAQEAQEATKPRVELVPAAPPVATVQPAPIEPPRPQFEEHTVKADSVVGIRLDQSLSSATARLEDRVTASVSRDLNVNGRTVLPTGTRLEGDVILVQPGSKFKGRARLGIRFHTLVLADGVRVPIQTETLYRDGESSTGSTAAKVGTGAAAGTILGAVLGGKKGAIIGAGVGVAGGTAAVMAGDTKEAMLERGTPLTMRVTNPVTLTIERDPLNR